MVFIVVVSKLATLKNTTIMSCISVVLVLKVATMKKNKFDEL
jgi:hypothetical protein